MRNVRGAQITVRCDCGGVGYVPYGERWECATCHRRWNTGQIPAEEYWGIMRDMRRMRISVILTALAWQAFGLIGGPVWMATLLLGAAMFMFDFGGVLYGINYLSLRQAITPDRLLGRMTATMRFLTVAMAPIGSLVGGVLATVIGLRGTLLTVGVLGLVLAGAAVLWSPVRRHRALPAVSVE